jgi:hypothetical protein
VAWRAHGGTEAEFESEWPRLRSELMLRRIADEQAERERVSARTFRRLWRG